VITSATSVKERFRHRLLQVSLWTTLVAVMPITVCAQQPVPSGSNPAATMDSASSVAEAKKLMSSGHFQEAESILRSNLAKDDRFADTRYLLAYALLRQNHPKEALEQYTLAAALQTPTASELNDVAKTYVLLEDYPDADKWLARSLEMNPKDPETWYSLGRLRFTEQRFADALDCFKRALELAPTSAKVENNLGLAYYGLNRTDEAEAAYRQAIHWQDAGPPQDVSEQPLLNLGILLVERGQLTEAKALLTRAAVIAPREPRIHEQLGQILMRQGSFSDAVEEFEKATQLDPEKPNLHFLLGQAYRRLGRQQDAKREFDMAARLPTHP
jgi:Flp pilus assembly protein TadD